MENKRYKTKQRDTILNFFLKHNNRCYTVRETIQALAEESTPVGEATVFRTLPVLADEGYLKRFTDQTGGASYRYDNGCSGHIHLKCRLCGTLVHLDCTFLEEITAHVHREHNFTLDPAQTVLYGLCGSCGGDNGVCSLHHHSHGGNDIR